MSCSRHLGTLKLWQVFVNIACIQLGTTVEVSLFDEMIIQGMKVARRESSYQTKSKCMEQPGRYQGHFQTQLLGHFQTQRFRVTSKHHLRVTSKHTFRVLGAGTRELGV